MNTLALARLLVVVAVVTVLVSCSKNEEPPPQNQWEQSQTKGTDLDPNYTK